MLQVIRLNSDSFIINSGGRSIPGDKVRTCLALAAIGIPWAEIENGLVSLEMNKHHIADYGVNGTFIFSARVDA